MLLLVSLVSTWYLVGLVWFVQAVAYPQFARVAVADFLTYHKAHTTWITPVVLPPMFVELGTAIALVWRTPHELPLQVALGLVAVVWVNTFAMAIPAHERLTHGHDASVIRWLVRLNWVRTIAWTVRGLLLLKLAAR